MNQNRSPEAVCEDCHQNGGPVAIFEDPRDGTDRCLHFRCAFSVNDLRGRFRMPELQPVEVKRDTV